MTDLNELSRLLEQARRDGEWQDFQQAMKRAAEALIRDARLGQWVRQQSVECHNGWRLPKWVDGAPSLETLDDAIAQEQP